MFTRKEEKDYQKGNKTLMMKRRSTTSFPRLPLQVLFALIKGSVLICTCGVVFHHRFLGKLPLFLSGVLKEVGIHAAPTFPGAVLEAIVMHGLLRLLHQVRVSGEKKRQLIYKETGTASASGIHTRAGWMGERTVGRTRGMASVQWT